MIELFWHPADSVFYDTGSDQEALIVRPRDTFDNAQPSGGSAASMASIEVCRIHQKRGFGEASVQPTLRTMRESDGTCSVGVFAWWLQAAEFYANPVKQVVIVGEKDHPATIAMLQEARNGFNPDRIVAHLGSGERRRSQCLDAAFRTAARWWAGCLQPTFVGTTHASCRSPTFEHWWRNWTLTTDRIAVVTNPVARRSPRNHPVDPAAFFADQSSTLTPMPLYDYKCENGHVYSRRCRAGRQTR